MSEQTFRSPGYTDGEIDQSTTQETQPTGVPFVVVGTANKGPAFVPMTFATSKQFKDVFGGLDSKKPALYAAKETLKHKPAVTFVRVLGAGANKTSADVQTTLSTGRVASTGFKLEGVDAVDDSRDRHNGAVQFITARHTITSNEAYGMPLFTDNDSFKTAGVANLVRGIVLMTTSSRLMVLNGDESAVGAFTATGPDDVGTVASGKVKLVISSTLGNAYWNTDLNPGVKILTASMDPTQPDYFAKILNTNPDKFAQEQHLLYADFAVDAELASASTVAVVSGSTATSSTSAEPSTSFRAMFGAFNTRYTTPTTTWFISQPFGTTEYDLFKFEALDDGEYANKLYKISIANIKASLDDSYPYGTFTVQVRSWDDNDNTPQIIEQFPNCTLDPSSKNYVAKVIGDRKLSFNLDVTVDTDKRVVTSGKYANKSKFIRIVMNSQVDRGVIPQKSLPFGFRGIETLKTNDALTDLAAGAANRLAGIMGVSTPSALTGSIVPPVPFRFKVTRGEVVTSGFAGSPGTAELANPKLYWGVKFERNTDPLNANISSEKNELIGSLTKFMGIKKLDALVTGSGADILCNNKFTLAKVALSNESTTDLTGSVDAHIREAAYIRNAKINTTDYTVSDGVLTKRLTLASVLSSLTAPEFNRFTQYTKFTNFMYGGWDGVNILDANARQLNDRASSFDLGGGAEATYVPPGLSTNPAGSSTNNNAVASYMAAIDIVTDPMAAKACVLAIPGIKESYVTDHAAQRCKDNGMVMYIMDIPTYSDDETRLFDDETSLKPDVDKTISMFDARNIDNSYSAAYWPNPTIKDEENKKRVKVPASIAAMSAYAFNDKVAYPWFAPAGFNRAALDFVTNVDVRLNSSDRDSMSDSRINPIATFPRTGYVIYNQKTLQIAESALQSVNVRRLMIDIKRSITDIARTLVFDNDTADLRKKFVKDANFQLGIVKANTGIDQFNVIMDETNNTQEDADLNRLNGSIYVVPTRTWEKIRLDFIITNSGVEFN